MELETPEAIETPGETGNIPAVEELQGEATTPDEKVEVDGTESAAVTTEDEDDEHKKQPPRGVQKRLDEITKEKYEWKREADYWREMATQRQQDGKVDGKASEVTSEITNTKPKSDNYDDYNDYLEALTDWKVDQRIAKEHEESKKVEVEREIQSQQAQVDKVFQESLKTAQSKHPDWVDTIKASPILFHPAAIGAMKESLDGAEVMYFLAKNPVEAERISQLSPMSQVREIGKIEVRLTPPKAPEPRRITNTGEPVKTVSGAGVVERDPDKMSMDDYAKWRMSQV